jgi:tetratricopeptide (TPR) repeat protein
VGAIDPKLLAAEVARVKRKARADLEAYDCFLRALDQTYPWTSEGHEEALRLLYQAIELDPDYAQAYAFAVYCYIRRFLTGRIFDAEQENELRRIAREAINRGKDDSFSLTWGGFGLAFLAPTTAQLQEGVAFIDQALLLNPNFAGAWHVSGWVRFWLGEPEIAIEHLARPMRLSPLDTGFHGMGAATAYAHIRAGSAVCVAAFVVFIGFAVGKFALA